MRLFATDGALPWCRGAPCGDPRVLGTAPFPAAWENDGSGGSPGKCVGAAMPLLPFCCGNCGGKEALLPPLPLPPGLLAPGGGGGGGGLPLPPLPELLAPGGGSVAPLIEPPLPRNRLGEYPVALLTCRRCVSGELHWSLGAQSRFDLSPFRVSFVAHSRPERSTGRASV